MIHLEEELPAEVTAITDDIYKQDASFLICQKTCKACKVNGRWDQKTAAKERKRAKRQVCEPQRGF